MEDFQIWLRLQKPQGIRTTRSYAVHHFIGDKKHVEMEHDTEPCFTEDQMSEILIRAAKWEQLSDWKIQAERQVFVADEVKLLKAAASKVTVYDTSPMAINISPAPEYSDIPGYCLSIMAGLTKLKCFSGGGKYVLEQRSEGNDKPFGWHIHGVVKCSFPPTKMNQFIQQKLKAMKYRAMTDVKRCYNDKFETQYIMGQKGDAEKDAKVIKDKILRTELSLQEVYTF